ncbi:MAG: CotH kinase family protein [Planctomycetia bacterium]|nr:CotH kinase family protein [Planctomycetia bacterium]
MRARRRSKARFEALEARQLLDARVVISEFLADNEISLRDETGHREDWIELFNAGDATANLSGWYLTDDAGELNKWRLPAVTIEPGQFFVLFASNNDQITPGLPLHTNFKLAADAGYLALVEPDGRTVASAFAPGYPPQIADVSYGWPQEFESIPLLPERAPGKAFVPTATNGGATLGTSWTAVDFDDSGWLAGAAGLGYERFASYTPYIGLNVNDTMYGQGTSAYLRLPFELDAVESYSTLNLRLKYDDGFAAYLNGTLVAARNVPASLTWQSGAFEDRADALALVTEDFDLQQYAHLLRQGENVLAIHGLNFGATSDDFLIYPELIAQRAGAIDDGAAHYFTTPTPGAPNGPGAADVGPILIDVANSPHEPTVDEPITVTANVILGALAVTEVKLTGRTGSGRQTKTFTQPMFDDGAHGDGAAGDGIYGTVIAAGTAPTGELIRYSITVVDTAGTATAWPRAVDPLDREQNYGLLIADPTVTSNLPVMYIHLPSLAGAESDVGTRGGVYYNGAYYDNVHFNIHGQSSRGFPKKSFNVDFPRDHRFEPFESSDYNVKDFNLLSNYADKTKLRNTLAYETYGDAGSVTHFAFPVRVQQNGRFLGVYDLVEDGDDDYLDRNGLDPFGALYKMYNSFNSTSEAEKKTRQEEGVGDLAAFQAGLRQSGAALSQFLWDNVDVASMANFLAAMVITGSIDCCHKNYYAYRDTLGNGEWTYLPWDLDLSFGRNWTTTFNYFDDGLYSQNPLYIGRGNLLNDALFADPRFNQMYLRRLRTLMDELLQSPDTPEEERHYESRIDALVEHIGADAALDNNRWSVWGASPTWEQQLTILREQYLAERRNYLFNLQSNGRGPIPVAQAAIQSLEIAQVEHSPASGNRDQQFIKIHNPTRGTIDISGWRIEGTVQHTFKAGTVLPSSGDLYVTPDAKAFRARDVGPRGNQVLFVQDGYTGVLPGSGGSIRIVDASGREVAGFVYEGEPSDAQKYLRITEINYHPYDPAAGSPFDGNDYEFVELTNIGDAPLDLTGVWFDQGVEFHFTHGAIRELAPGAHVLIVANEAAFRERYGDALPVAGMYSGQLSNSGEGIIVRDTDDAIIHNFAYSDAWFRSTDGDGETLVIQDTHTELANWGLKQGWRASRLHGGSPGREDVVQQLGDADGDNDVDIEDLLAVRTQFGRDSGGLGDADHDGDVDVSDLNAVRNHFGVSAPMAVARTPDTPTTALSATRFTLGAAHDAVFGMWNTSPTFEGEKPRRRREFR